VLFVSFLVTTLSPRTLKNHEIIGEAIMPTRCLAVFIMTILIAAAPAFAQLGPKDGGNLSATDLDRVKAGQLAPDFTLENFDGKAISLSDFRGKKNVLLVFYRGQW
jgi:cytochrome oxidase Cu insertion factor (SCO1/SenC/PrrC family)